VSVNLVIVGGTVVDFVLPRVTRLPSWPRHTESTPDNLVRLRRAPIMTLGGNGANAAYVAARCGATVTLHTLLGADALGGFARGWLEDAGCGVQVPGRVKATAVNITAANSRQERAVFYYAGEAPAMPAIMTARLIPSHLLVCGWPHPPLEEMGQELGRAPGGRVHGAGRRSDSRTALDHDGVASGLCGARSVSGQRL
jgi:ribokinase